MKDKAYFYRFLRPIVTFLFKIYYNPVIINKDFIPKEDACILAGNHRHAFDPLFAGICTKRTLYSLGKKELHDGPFGWFFYLVGTIPVDTHIKNNKGALTTATNYLKNNKIINIYHEGTRNYTNEILLPFKYGAVVMAKRANCKIIPYSITGDYKFRSKNLKIVFGKPFSIEKMSIEEANILLYKKIKKLIKENKESEK